MIETKRLLFRPWKESDAPRCVTKISENENYDDFIAKQENPNAYEPWTEEADAELARLWSEGKSVADIADHFGRKNTAIITRLKKLGL